jgi:hypothetical protein
MWASLNRARAWQFAAHTIVDIVGGIVDIVYK